MRWHRGWPELLAWLALATTALVVSPLNSDAGYVLVAARRVLDGDRLYVDLIETNTPLIFWLMSVPAMAGTSASLSDARLVALFTAALLWLATACGGLAAGRVPGSVQLLRGWVIGAYCLASVFLFLTQVGQREQVAVMLLLPQSVLAACAAAGHRSPRGLSLAGGVMAGLAVAIKPFFLAPWVAMELVVIALRGRRATIRADVGALLLVQCGYAAAVLAWHPDYVTRVLPLLSDWYGAYTTDRLGLVGSGRVVVIALAALAAIVCPHWLPRDLTAACARIFGAATLGWLLSYIVQGKGWLYQLLPAEVSAAAALAALGAALVQHAGWRRGLQVVARVSVPLAIGSAATGIAAITAGTGGAVLRGGAALSSAYPGWFTEMQAAVEKHAAGQPVYVMSTSVWPTFPLVNVAHLPWPYHYHFLWPIPALYAGAGGGPYRLPEQQDPREREFFETVVGDLVRTPPRLLFVERSAAQQAMQGRVFDFVEDFSGSPAFRLLFARYTRLADIATWDVYLLDGDADGRARPQAMAATIGTGGVR